MDLAVREATVADAELLWRWANDPETRRHAFARAPIPWDSHVAWLERRLAGGSTDLWIFSDAAGPVGQVRFDLAAGVAAIDIAVAPARRGRGYGRAMLASALARLRAARGPAVRPRAEVLEHNTRSLRMFRACGFEPVAVEERGGERVIVLEPAAPAGG